MKMTDNIWLEWHINSTALILAILLFAFHYTSNGKRFTGKSFYFFSGIALLLLVTQSPLEFLGHHYLFSAHMLQHVVILLIVPPLLLAGTEGRYFEKFVQKNAIKKTGSFLFHPVIAWLLGVGSMWFWHIPALIMAMKSSPSLMALHITSLLILGIIFIWPVYAPLAFQKLTPLQSAVYLFTACVGCTTLGIFITFGPAGLFTSYLTGNQVEVLTLIRSRWGITPAIDQQIGGLIMWVPACIVYVTNTVVTLGKWFSNQNNNSEIQIETITSGRVIPE